jgi:hypothetical protein
VKYLSPFRIAAGLLVVFCTLHTAGGMLSNRSRGSAADDVLSIMKNVHFTFMGADCTYYGFYLGFGLMVSAFLLFAAIVAWQLGGMGAGDRVRTAPIAWGLFACLVLTAVLSWAYFFPGPGVISSVIALLLGVGCVRERRRSPARSHDATTAAP